MQRRYFLLMLMMSLTTAVSQAQTPVPYTWWNPAKSDFNVVRGQGWPEEVAQPYDRLPARAKKEVNPSVWERSQDAAGLTIRFYANTSTIRVRYGVSRERSKPHITTTGKSGLDLYAMDKNGKWEWCPGQYNFGDTITYQFHSLKQDFIREYCLYLPYYNQVTWLEIGMPAKAKKKFLPVNEDKPIVIYGTSITQGTAAPRPGLTWPAILERRLHTPVINLGFAGCGRLDAPVIDLMCELDAGMYVLDCLPNLVGRTKVIEERLNHAVKILQQRRPGIPILIVDHADAHIASLNTLQYEKYSQTNEASRKAFAELIASGVNNIYYLSADSIGLNEEDMAIDGVHPNATGMGLYAAAYEKAIRQILREPDGAYSTMRPSRQFRDQSYDWNKRHHLLLNGNKENPPRIVLLGNSIVQHWGGILDSTIHRGADSWDNFFAPLGVRNFGFGSDRIENMLWRVYHGELDGYVADQVIIMAGTNNLGVNSDEEITAGLRLLFKAIIQRQPSTKLLMVGILPRKGQERRVAAINKKIAWLCSNEGVQYINPGIRLSDSSGQINQNFFTAGGLHPDSEGYQILAKAIAPYIVRDKK